jgi:hypothetical protein
VNKVKRDKIDIVFSKLVRRKSKGICAVGVLYPDLCKSPRNNWKYGMDCSHTGFGRRNQSTRYSFLNCDAVCKGCHRKLGESSIFATEFKYKQLGSKKFHKLTDERNQLCKRTKADKEELYQDLKRQFKELDEDFDFA